MGLKILYLPFFLIELCYHNLVFVLGVIWIKYSRTLSTSLIVLGLCLYGLFFWNRYQQRQTQLLSFSLAQQHQHQIQLQQLKNEWLEKLSHQPTHRDILYNLAKISCELEDEDCEKFTQQAQQADPNGKLFND